MPCVSTPQVSLSCMVSPPQPGDASYPLYQEEFSSEMASLKRRAQMVSEAFDALPGMSCNPTEGAMYSFPKVRHRV
jgi:aspartate/methionine/tyrosine aminotransferase